MALKRGKYDIEILDDDAINHNRICYDLCDERSIVWIDYICIEISF